MRSTIDNQLLAMDNVTRAPLFVGMGHLVEAKPFTVQAEDVLALQPWLLEPLENIQ